MVPRPRHHRLVSRIELLWRAPGTQGLQGHRRLEYVVPKASANGCILSPLKASYVRRADCSRGQLLPILMIITQPGPGSPVLWCEARQHRQGCRWRLCWVLVAPAAHGNDAEKHIELTRLSNRRSCRSHPVQYLNFFENSTWAGHQTVVSRYSPLFMARDVSIRLLVCA